MSKNVEDTKYLITTKNGKKIRQIWTVPIVSRGGFKMKILVLNSGSSSLKYQVIDMDTEKVLAKGYFERIGQQNSFLTHKVNGEKHKFEKHVENHEQALEFVFSRLTNDHYGVIKSLEELGGIGHRVVQGGEKYSQPVLIGNEVIEEIKKCSELAP